MRGPCLICDDEKYHDLCPKCGNCVDHCVCARVAQTSASEVCGPSHQNEKPQTAIDGGLRYQETPEITLCGAVVWAYDPKKLVQEPPASKGMVLIEHVNLERRWVSRCDAWCHESRGGPCACLCGGIFHGIQEKSERWNNLILDMGPSLVARYKPLGVDVSGLEKELETLKA